MWEGAFQMVPLLLQLAKQPWYELTPLQALRQYVALSKSAADRLAIGPRLEAEHFFEVGNRLPGVMLIFQPDIGDIGTLIGYFGFQKLPFWGMNFWPFVGP